MDTHRPMEAPRIVSRAEWLVARKAHLAHEKEMTRALDRLRAERRALPWVRVEADYRFEGPDGTRSLADLFGSKSQLAVYHFMLPPGKNRPCDGCAFVMDHVDAARMHFEHNDLAFAAISRAPYAEIAPVRQRMGWTFPWLSSHGTRFNYDYDVAFTPDQVATRQVPYNYGTTPYAMEDLPGISIFARDGSGQLFHTYSAYARGLELLDGAYNYLDLAPKGRNEKSIGDWIRLHDEYDDDQPGCPACGPG